MTTVKPPDFEEMMELIDIIGKLTHEKLLLEAKISFMRSEILKKVTTDESFFKGDKPPAFNFAETTYLVTGINDELIAPRVELADVTAKLEHAKLRFDVLKMQLDIYRTEAANARYASL
jgi:hypothetical protein